MSHTRTAANRRTGFVRALVALACAAILAGCEEGPATSPTPDPPPKANPSLKAVYWIHGGGIQRADAAGRNVTILVPRLRPIIGMAVDGIGDKLYWTSWLDAGYKIQRANLDGSGTEDIIIAESGPVLNSYLALDTANGKMYWTTSGYVIGSGTSRIRRANLDGSGAEELVRDAGASISAIALDAANGKMYWATSDGFHTTSRIRRANLDGTGVEVVTESHDYILSIEVADGRVFWTTASVTEKGSIAGGAIRRARLGGTGVEDLVIFVDSPFFPIGLDVADGKVYWTTTQLSDHGGLYRGGQIRRANLDGTGAEDLAIFPPSSSAPAALDVIDGRMYWSEIGLAGVPSTVSVADTEGSDIDEVIVNTGLLFAHGAGIALDRAAGRVYWTEKGIAGVRRANLDGTGVEDLIADAALGFGVERAGIALDVDRGEMYWTQSGHEPERIQRARFDGTSVEVVADNVRSPRGIALDLDSRKMYWTEGGDVGVRRANLDGTAVEDLVSSDRDTRGEGIALDVGNRKIYWIEKATGTTGSSERRARIRRANLDGTAVEDLVADQSSDLAGLALDVANGKMYWTETVHGHDGRVVQARIRRASLDGSDVEVYTELDPAHAQALGGIALDIR